MKVKDAKALLEMALAAAGELDDPELSGLLAQLAGVSEVQFSEQTDTACIKRSADRYRICFSKSFVEKYLSTPQDILFVLLHEIMHKVRGDLIRDMGLKSRLDHRVANLAEDMLINAELCARFFPEPPPLLQALYCAEEFPGVLLTPPKILIQQAGETKMPGGAEHVLAGLRILKDDDPRSRELNELTEDFQALMEGHFQRIQQEVKPSHQNHDEAEAGPLLGAYVSAWLWFGLESVDSIYEMIRPYFGTRLQYELICVLLGDHEDKEDAPPGWEKVFEEKGDHWGGYSEEEIEQEIDLETPCRHAPKVARLLKQALDADPMNPLENMLFQSEKSVIPWIGRRENLWIANGLWPVFFNSPVYSKELDYLRPHIYIDVSGSTEEHQPMIYGLVHHLADIIGEPIYLFSNIVAEASMKDIGEGKMMTTGGTDFDCVIEHAIKNRFRKIVIITDGCAKMNETNRKTISSGKIEMHMVLTERVRPDEELMGLAKTVLTLD